MTLTHDADSRRTYRADSGATAAAERHLRFRPDIEGLRAVAIVLVVLYHAGWGRVPGGFLGVDVFFVLSGFLITGLLLDEGTATGSISLTGFWARRARRLLPAAAVIVVVVLILDAILLSPLEQIIRADTSRAFAFYGSNILFAVRSADYFGGAATRDPLLHTWSLSVEEQFYLCFAPTLLALAAWSSKRGADVFRRRLLIATVIISVASLIGCAIMVRQYPLIAFYILPTRAWEFGFGSLTVIGVGLIRRVNARAIEAVSLLSAGALVASAVLASEGVVPPLGPATLFAALGTVGLIFTGASERPSLIARALSTAPMRLVGRLSYSWYLWHWPMLVFLREVVPSASLRTNVGVAILSLVPAAVTYAWIESPIRFSTRLQRRPAQVVAGAIVLAALTYAAGWAAIQYANRVLSSPRFATILAARAVPSTYDNGCHLSQIASVSPDCTYGPGTNDTTMVLFGDSHAAQWFPAVDSLVKLRGWKLVNLTKRGCPSVTVALVNPKLGRRYTECDTWREYAINRIVASRPTVVLVTNARTYNVIVGDRQPLTDTSEVARRAWSAGLTRTLTALAPSGARLVVLEDTPQSSRDVPSCLVKYIDTPTRCDVAVNRALNPLMAAAERAAVGGVAGVGYISLNENICDGAICPVSRDGMVRFMDPGHLSVRYSASLTPALSTALTRVLSEVRPR